MLLLGVVCCASVVCRPASVSAEFIGCCAVCTSADVASVVCSPSVITNSTKESKSSYISGVLLVVVCCAGVVCRPSVSAKLIGCCMVVWW